MLCYTYVTDIVRHSDELEMLRAALDQVQPGIILLDEFLNAQFLNRAVRNLWKISDEQAARKPPYVELVNDARTTGTFDVPPEELSKYIAGRIAVVRAGDPAPVDIPHSGGGIIRSQCAILPNGGRMVTYTEVTDLVRRANEFERLATLDGVTGICNRRHFDVLAEAEWNRFQRYSRPLSLILLDVDCFKDVNDRFGHEIGDKILTRLAAICTQDKRSSDVVARIGGDEFAILLPETDVQEARVVAERIGKSIAKDAFLERTDTLPVTVSVGIAGATLGMSGPGALMRLADKALYEAKSAGRNCIKAIEELPTLKLRAAAE